MTAKYEASVTVTLIAAATASNLMGRAAHIRNVASRRGHVERANRAIELVVGVFAQDAMTQDEPVTVNLLQGKIPVQAESAFTGGRPVVPNGTDGRFAEVDAETITDADLANLQVIGISLAPQATVDGLAQVLCVPITT